NIKPNSIKTGMITTTEMMELIASYFEKYRAIPYCLDPVMVATSGDVLMEEASQIAIKKRLVPLATIVTPNLPETEILVGKEVTTIKAMEEAAIGIVQELGARTAVVKGGHLEGAVIDVFYDGDQIHHL